MFTLDFNWHLGKLLFKVQALWGISKSDSATQHHTWYLSQLSKTLSPHFLSVRVPGIWPDRRSITMSEHLKVRTEISSRSHRYSFLSSLPARGRTGFRGRGGGDSVTSSGSVSIINPRTCFFVGLSFFLKGVKWHTCWLSRITGTCQWLSTENKTLNKQQSQSFQSWAQSSSSVMQAQQLLQDKHALERAGDAVHYSCKWKFETEFSIKREISSSGP